MTTTLAPIVKTLVVPVSRERAFDHFTAGIGRWWPLATHSVHGADARTAVIEPRVGGRLYERTADGREADWGEVRVWQPPARLVFSFMKYAVDRPTTEVEVTFETVGGGTRVTLEHRGWEQLGAELRGGYDEGWDHVFGECYRGAIAAVR